MATPVLKVTPGTALAELLEKKYPNLSIVISVKLDLSTIKTSLITSSLLLPASGDTLFITILVSLCRTELKFSISIFPVLLVLPGTTTSYDTNGFKDD